MHPYKSNQPIHSFTTKTISLLFVEAIFNTKRQLVRLSVVVRMDRIAAAGIDMVDIWVVACKGVQSFR